MTLTETLAFVVMFVFGLTIAIIADRHRIHRRP
jgi:hypothetical protein